MTNCNKNRWLLTIMVCLFVCLFIFKWWGDISRRHQVYILMLNGVFFSGMVVQQVVLSYDGFTVSSLHLCSCYRLREVLHVLPTSVWVSSHYPKPVWRQCNTTWSSAVVVYSSQRSMVCVCRYAFLLITVNTVMTDIWVNISFLAAWTKLINLYFAWHAQIIK